MPDFHNRAPLLRGAAWLDALMMIDNRVPADPTERRHALFADAETREDAAKQIIGGELTGDFAERLLCAAQLFSDELARAPFAQLARAFFDVGSRTRQRVEVALTRRDGASFYGVKAHRELEMSAQHVEAVTGQR